MHVGLKSDSDKDPWHLAPWDSFRAIVKVLNYGQRKYSARNWEKGMAWSRVYSALMRHMIAWFEGENKDLETGYSHLWHAGCCVAFLIAYELRGIGEDDRPLGARSSGLVEPLPPHWMNDIFRSEQAPADCAQWPRS